MPDTTREAWETGRPTLNRLPEKGYRDNDLADALTAWHDDESVAKKQQLEAFYLELHPDTAASESLDFLAYLVGFSGAFWDTTWTDQVKRDLIRLSHNYIWKRRGTLDVIKTILDIHGLVYSVWQPTVLTLPFKMTGTFGGGSLRVTIRLGIDYIYKGREWKEAERTLRNFAPAVTDARVTYERFYMGFSKLGDQMFSK